MMGPAKDNNCHNNPYLRLAELHGAALICLLLCRPRGSPIGWFARSVTSSGVASTYPKPDDVEAYVKAQQYDPTYSPALPAMYSWPDA